VVSDFGLIDAIESGLVKVPQLAVRDATGDDRAKYFNIWRWITGLLTSAEKGGRKGSPKPEAVLKYATAPILMMGADHEETIRSGRRTPTIPTSVFISSARTRRSRRRSEWLPREVAASIPTVT
jgi:type III restriction enzyme